MQSGNEEIKRYQVCRLGVVRIFVLDTKPLNQQMDPDMPWAKDDVSYVKCSFNGKVFGVLVVELDCGQNQELVH